MREEKRVVRMKAVRGPGVKEGAGTVLASAPHVPTGKWVVASSFPTPRHLKF